MRQLTTIREVPSLLILCININNLKLDPYLKFRQNDESVNTLKLRGLIYHSELAGQVGGHFTTVVVDAAGNMWYHDGMTTRRTCVNNGRLADVQDLLTLHRRNDQRLCAVVYALA
ncbi:hypothetical protein B0H13DRAFT_1609185 [Mycena leptocephala]|nr:hypothetical protein B0H13DRAFT_1609185 [Mycena leptocephala]